MRYLRVIMLVSAALALPVEAAVVAMGTSACMQESQASAYSIQAGSQSSCQQTGCLDIDPTCQAPCASCGTMAPGNGFLAMDLILRPQPVVRRQNPDTLPPHDTGLLRPPDVA
ncbi:hypothetical protein PC39_10462 [Salinisphaera sp. PC39]